MLIIMKNIYIICDKLTYDWEKIYMLEINQNKLNY